MILYGEYDEDYEVEDLRQEARAQRAFLRKLCAHPDYRDPDYPESDPDEEEDEDE